MRRLVKWGPTMCELEVACSNAWCIDDRRRSSPLEVMELTDARLRVWDIHCSGLPLEYVYGTLYGSTDVPCIISQ